MANPGYDNATMYTEETGAATKTFSHTVGTGDNRLLLVFVTWYTRVTGVTYATVAMTAGGAAGTDATDAAVNNGVYYLAAPTSGANNVVVSFSPNTAAEMFGAASYTGCDQINPIGATSSLALVHANQVSNSLTTLYSNSAVVDEAVQYNDANGFTAGGSQSSRATAVNGNLPNSGGVSDQGANSPGSYGMSWTGADADSHVIHSIVEIRSPVGGAVVRRSGSTLSMMGIG